MITRMPGFIGYTTRLTCGAWVGMDRPQSIADKGYGSKLALPIWVDFVQNASAWKYVAQNFGTPGNLRGVQLCRTSGGIATPECAVAGTMYQAQLPPMMIPHNCTDHGGALAGLSTDGSQRSQHAPVAQLAPESVSVAPAVPSTSELPTPTEQGSNYRMIRTRTDLSSKVALKQSPKKRDRLVSHIRPSLLKVS